MRTMNLKIDLWQRLVAIRSKNPKLGSLNEVIEAVLEQNKKLKKELIVLRGGYNERNKSEDTD
jgi:hypothetical protein